MRIREIYETIKSKGLDGAYLEFTKNLPKEKRNALDQIVAIFDAPALATEIISEKSEKKSIGGVAAERLDREIDYSSMDYPKAGSIAAAVTLSTFLFPWLCSVTLEAGRAAYREMEKMYKEWKKGRKLQTSSESNNYKSPVAYVALC